LGAPADPKEGQQTTHFSVVDAAGNAVAVTYTLNGWFGSHRVAGDTGILMNNEMDDFTSKRGAPNMFGLVQGAANAIAPGKTPLSSMSPTILAKNGHLVMVTGSPGGSRIITITVETIVNVLDHGMTLQDAIDAPRIHHQYQPDLVDIEPGALTPEVRKTLEAQGYVLRDRPLWGHAESILVGGERLDDADLTVPETRLPARLFGANDRRASSGAASGY
jgi:gamma-glutamyltranspeptidase/glutathione hydrolase